MTKKSMSQTNGVKKPNKPKPTMLQRRLARKTPRTTALAEKISQMRLVIAPIVHVETGLPPADFPHSMLSLFLLTEDQLDRMAHYYSQVTPSLLTFQYPNTMNWHQPFLDTDSALPENCRLTALERVRVKTRMFARFIGMRGADTPRWEYERQVEILRNKIGREREEGRLKKYGWMGV